MRIEHRALFAAARERVWETLTDWEAQASWMPDVARVSLLGPERGPGARIAVRTKVLGVPALTDLLKVVDWEPPERLVVEHRGLVRGRGEWLLEAAGEGRTRFTWREELRLPPSGLGETALVLYGPLQRAMLRRSVRNLGRLVERP